MRGQFTMAILLAGLLGTAAEWVRDTPGHLPPRLFGIPAGRALAVVVAGLMVARCGRHGHAPQPPTHPRRVVARAQQPRTKSMRERQRCPFLGLCARHEKGQVAHPDDG